MPKNFGDILYAWEEMTGKPYGKKQIKKDRKNKNLVENKIKAENEKK